MWAQRLRRWGLRLMGPVLEEWEIDDRHRRGSMG
jgi:hypothetical protein